MNQQKSDDRTAIKLRDRHFHYQAVNLRLNAVDHLDAEASNV